MSEQIVFLDDESLLDSIELPTLEFEHEWISYPYTHDDQVVEHLQNATIALTCSVPMSGEQLAQLPNLEMISLALTGMDIVDLDYCREHGITVTNVPGYAANTVAEHTLALMFNLFRHIGDYHRLITDVYRGARAPSNVYLDYTLRDVAGKRLGIIGHGAIAFALADKARALGMTVAFSDRGGHYQGTDYIDFDQLIETSDVVSVNCPLTDETRDLIGVTEIARMKSDALLINTGRGGIVNEAALIDAVKHSRIGGAALDVVEQEPIAPDDPILALVDRPNFVLTPHVAWSSQDAMQQLINSAVNNIAEFVAAKTTHQNQMGLSQ